MRNDGRVGHGDLAKREDLEEQPFPCFWEAHGLLILRN